MDDDEEQKFDNNSYLDPQSIPPLLDSQLEEEKPNVNFESATNQRDFVHILDQFKIEEKKKIMPLSLDISLGPFRQKLSNGMFSTQAVDASIQKLEEWIEQLKKQPENPVKLKLNWVKGKKRLPEKQILTAFSNSVSVTALDLHLQFVADIDSEQGVFMVEQLNGMI